MSTTNESFLSGETVCSDALLVQRCLGKDEAAWQMLYQRHHHRLVGVIARLLLRSVPDENLAEEVASLVWWLLLAEDKRRLRAFDPARAQFGTYLARLARGQLTQLRRAEQRRRRHLRGLARLPAAASVPPHLALDTVLGEFLPTLRPNEREFLQTQLTATTADPQSVSPPWQRKRRQRTHDKFLAYLQDE